MQNLAVNLFQGALNKLRKNLYRPYSVFDISWLKEKMLKHSHSRSISTHTYQGKYKISYSDRQAFLLSVNEIFIDEIYKFKTDNHSPYIIDCGSHIGMSLLYFSMHYKNAKIIAFEPDDFNYKLAEQNITQCNLNNVKLNNSAVWITNGEIDFDSSGDMSSSIKNAKTENSILTKCIKLRDYLDKKVDFLKMDIEGAEYEVLMDCSDKLHLIDNLFIEYHGDFNENHKLNAILDILIKNNFTYYIKEAGNIYPKPFWENEKSTYLFDVQLNIFCFKNK